MARDRSSPSRRLRSVTDPDPVTQAMRSSGGVRARERVTRLARPLTRLTRKVTHADRDLVRRKATHARSDRPELGTPARGLRHATGSGNDVR